MELSKINSLVELFFEKNKEKKNLPNQPFLKCLKNEKENFLSWSLVGQRIYVLSEYLKKKYLLEIDAFYYLKIDQNGLLLI